MAILAGLLLLWQAGHAAPPVPDYTAQQVSARVYVIHGPTGTPSPENLGFMNNPALVIGDDAVAVFDPGSSYESGRMVLRQLAALTDKPVTHVFNSHIHGDHWLGNHAIKAAYPGAVFLAHPEMIRRAEAGVGEEWLRRLSQMTDGATDGTEAVIPARAVADGETFRVGGLTVRVHIIEAAHSHTDAMFEVVEESLLYTGDNVTYQRMPRFDDGTFRGSLAACDHALSLGLRHYVPGHGPSGGAEVVESFRNYVTTLYDSVGEFYEQGQSDFEMKDAILERLVDYHDWASFDEFIGRTISLALLENEKAAFE